MSAQESTAISARADAAAIAAEASVLRLHDEVTLPANLAAGTIHWLLRIACVCEFVGHGAFGIITKPVWLNYFDVVGIPPSLAYQLMPVIGSIDISLGILVFFTPVRAALLYMAFWGFLTATIRPLAGEPIWEWIERASNMIAPLALIYVRGWPKTLREWLS